MQAGEVGNVFLDLGLVASLASKELLILGNRLSSLTH
jgi:hypothetical protein